MSHEEKSSRGKQMWRSVLGITETEEETTNELNNNNSEKSEEKSNFFSNFTNRKQPGQSTERMQESSSELFRFNDRSSVFTNNSENMKICKPTVYSDSKDIADAILNHKYIILNMNLMTNDSDAQRLIEFISGVCYSQKIELEDIETNIWAIEPRENKRTSLSAI